MKINNRYKTKNLINEIFFYSLLKKDIKPHFNTDFKKTSFFKKDETLFMKISLISLILFLLVYVLYNQIEKSEINMGLIYLPLFFIIYTLSFYFINHFRKNEPRISLNENEIRCIKYQYIFKKIDNKILWDEILILKLLKIRHSNNSNHTLKIILGKTNLEIEEIEISDLDTDPYEIIEIIKKE